MSRARRARAQRLLNVLLAIALGAHLVNGWMALATRLPTGSSTHSSIGAPQPVVVDLSHAPVWRLRLLPGIGIKRAYAIVDDRLQNGPLRSFEELERIPGLGPGIAAALRRCTSVRVAFGAGDPPRR